MAASYQFSEGMSHAIMEGNTVERNYVVASEFKSNDNVSLDTDFHPYIKVSFHRGTSKKTDFISHSDANPEWNETLSFNLSSSTFTKILKQEETVGVGWQEKAEELWLTFEAWHRDLSMSLDDHIGSGTLSLERNRFLAKESWSANECIRLTDKRGVSVGSLHCRLKWKKAITSPMKSLKQIDGSFEAEGMETIPVNNSLTAANTTLVEVGAKETHAAVDTTIIGTLHVTLESANHLIDPNHNAGLAITRSTRMLVYSTLVVLSYFALGAFVYLTFEGPESGINTIVPDPNLSNMTGVIKFTGIIDTMYFSVCTFTTVGYGDVVPQSTGLKLFTVIYSLCGVAIVAVGVNVMVNACLASTHEWIAIIGNEYNCYCWRKTNELVVQHQKQVTVAAVRGRLFALLFKMLGVIAIGTIAYMMPGMIEDDKPGLNFVNSLYMATMTASSIGFGDLSPKNNRGRLFFVFWMIGGYVIVASSIREISQLYLELKERQAEKRILNREVGLEALGMDDDGDGEVDRYEYLSHMVVVLGKMRMHEVQEIMNRFKELDVTGDGKLSRADFETLVQ
jgi:potassium channel subfamily K